MIIPPTINPIEIGNSTSEPRTHVPSSTKANVEMVIVKARIVEAKTVEARTVDATTGEKHYNSIYSSSTLKPTTKSNEEMKHWFEITNRTVNKGNAVRVIKSTRNAKQQNAVVRFLKDVISFVSEAFQTFWWVPMIILMFSCFY